MFSRITPGVIGLTASLLYFSSNPIPQNDLTDLTLLSALIGFCTFHIYSSGSRFADFHLPYGKGQGISPSVVILAVAAAAVFPFLHLTTLIRSLPQLALAGALTFAYYLPIHSRTRTITGLREIFLVKNVVLALAWSIATTPLFTVKTDDYGLFVFRILFILALSIVTDIRDGQSDSQHNTITLSMKIGSRKSTIVSFCLILFAAGLSWTTLSHPENPAWQSLIIPLHTIATGLGVLSLHGQSKPITYFWLIDFQLFVNSLIYLMLSVFT